MLLVEVEPDLESTSFTKPDCTVRPKNGLYGLQSNSSHTSSPGTSPPSSRGTIKSTLARNCWYVLLSGKPVLSGDWTNRCLISFRGCLLRLIFLHVPSALSVSPPPINSQLSSNSSPICSPNLARPEKFSRGFLWLSFIFNTVRVTFWTSSFNRHTALKLLTSSRTWLDERYRGQWQSGVGVLWYVTLFKPSHKCFHKSCLCILAEKHYRH